ncbi:MAG: 2-oxoacid:acceptor oxidoreductase family protein [Thermoanaerobaculia bacterium]|jgi:2-oxoacid:acceptor oxidoreductase gamma subunit (pyruvate/2-ketoisovalerate family)
MIEMTLYGRGGQGGVTLAKLVATAWFLRGKDAQAFGVYAAERAGAPIQAFIRIDDVEITNHNQIREPDHVIVIDPTLIGPNVVAGLKPDGWLILNTPVPAEQWMELFPGRRVATIDATGIAVAHGLGTRAVPIVNTTMMGAVAKIFDLSLDEVRATFAELRFGGANVTAAEEAYEKVAMAALPGERVMPAPIPLSARIAGILDPDVGAAPKIRTGSWATRRPQRRTLTPPCNHNCPASNDVQAFVEAMGHKQYSEALAIILETSPLPGICGRVCPAPCMEACNRKSWDEGINVRELERYAADHGTWPAATKPTRHEKVAVVGSGPAGLSAAYQLAKLGYPVTMFEGANELGGVLRNGIPDYRLPKDVLDREIGWILDHGITVFTDEFIDRKALLRLSNQFAAVFVATGLQDSRGMKLGAVEPGDVEQGIDFLDAVHKNDAHVAGMRVVVVGGGNTAIDAARSALRLGAASVRIVYRRSRLEMPAIAEEIDDAIDEGVKLDVLMLPVRYDRVNGIGKLTVTRMKLGEPDASGRRTPVVDDSPDAQFVIECDKVVLALGQSADLSIIGEGAEIRENGRLLGLAEAPIFLGGDFGKNDGTVTAAIGSGRLAALHIHQTIAGEDLFPCEPAPVAGREVIHEHLFAHAPRETTSVLPRDIRVGTFVEVRGGLEDYPGHEAAVAEAQRCFSCGVCNSCDRCLEHCPEGILLRDREGYRFNYDYCKGCGLCATQCPRGVVVMAEL